MSLVTPQSVRKLPHSLHVKAKRKATFRFYSLYDKLYREDILRFAWRLCRANGGSAGVDGETFASIERAGEVEWLEQLAQELRAKRYRPEAVRRVYLPKPDGGQRPLGIPTIKDRVVPMAAVLVLEPIFEVDLQPEQYAYRPSRSAHDAVREVHRWWNRGYGEVVDADLKGYFDTIPHPELLKCLSRRISDGAMLKLLKQWLEMPIEENGQGGKGRSNPARKWRRGTPQGAPISPLLANLYMRRFIFGWKTLGYAEQLRSHIVNYADDFVILCRGTGVEALEAMRHIMKRVKLTVNEKKTRLCRIPEESFEFLGYTIGRCHSPRTGKAYLGTKPSKTKVQRVNRRISEMTRANTQWRETGQIVTAINRQLRGWGHYFCLGSVSKAYRTVDSHSRYRLRQWLRKKHKRKGAGTKQYPDEYLHDTLGLVCLGLTTGNLPWAKT